MNIRQDSCVFKNKEEALETEQWWSAVEKEYNTVINYDNGYVVTNKFDPQCNDKITPVTPNFINSIGRSS